MSKKSNEAPLDKAIFPDKIFREQLQENAEQAWRDYCNANGIDPDAADKSLDDWNFRHNVPKV